MIALAVTNATSAISDSDVLTACAAIQRQVSEHLLPAWGINAVIHDVPRGQQPPAGAYVIELRDETGLDGALGYHEDPGSPDGYVGVKTCADDGVSWSSCLSHEICELLCDPECVRCVQVGARVLALEVCDPVEQQTYLIGSVEVSNFVLPAWYVEGSAGPWDYLGRLTGPLQLASGGYLSACAISGDWSQTNADQVRTDKRIARPGSRRARRLGRCA